MIPDRPRQYMSNMYMLPRLESFLFVVRQSRGVSKLIESPNTPKLSAHGILRRQARSTDAEHAIVGLDAEKRTFYVEDLGSINGVSSCE